MKTNLFIRFHVLLIACLMIATNLKGAEPEFQFKTLTEWSNSFFNGSPEFSYGLDDGDHGTMYKDFRGIEPLEFEKVIDTLIKKYGESDLHDKKFWISEQVPPSEIFNVSYKTATGVATPPSNDTIGEFYHPYVEKVLVPEESKACFMGDYHSSAHSLLRNLWRLVSLGHLGDDFKIKTSNFYLILLGDFADRGRYGAEVWYTIARLKLANWNKVFLLRGNHETIDASSRYGFFNHLLGELHRKFKDENKTDDENKELAEQLIQKMSVLYRILPHALYLGEQSKNLQPNQDPGHDFVQCSHGGLSCGAIDPSCFEPKELLEDKTGRKYRKIIAHEGFNWSDFKQNDGIEDNCRGMEKAYLAGIESAKNYLKINNIKAFFRGHQDKCFGLKMFLDEDYDVYIDEDKFKKLGGTIPSDTILINSVFLVNKDKTKFHIIPNIGGHWSTSSFSYAKSDLYKNGPYHWKYIVSQADQDEAVKTSSKGFLLKNYAPIFTFTSASEGQRTDYDCFGIVTIGARYEDWRMQVYETCLEPTAEEDYLQKKASIKRNNKYVSLFQPKGTNDQAFITAAKEEEEKNPDNFSVVSDEHIAIVWTKRKVFPVKDLATLAAAQSGGVPGEQDKTPPSKKPKPTPPPKPAHLEEQKPPSQPSAQAGNQIILKDGKLGILNPTDNSFIELTSEDFDTKKKGKYSLLVHPLFEGKNAITIDGKEYKTLLDLIKLFLEKRGTIIIPSSPTKIKPEKGSEYTAFFKDLSFELQPNDVVYPVCTAGGNRSQVLYKALNDLISDKSIMIKNPHGGLQGFDPFHEGGFKNKNAVLWAYETKTFLDQKSKKVDPLITNFNQIFGEDSFKSRFGQEIENKKSQDRFTFFDKEYYGKKEEGKRRVFIVFGESFHIVLKRLLETNSDLSDVTLIGLSLDDPTKEKNMVDSVKQKRLAFLYFGNRLMFTTLSTSRTKVAEGFKAKFPQVIEALEKNEPISEASIFEIKKPIIDVIKSINLAAKPTSSGATSTITTSPSGVPEKTPEYQESQKNAAKEAERLKKEKEAAEEAKKQAEAEAQNNTELTTSLTTLKTGLGDLGKKLNELTGKLILLKTALPK